MYSVPFFILLAQSRQLVSGKNLTLRSNIWCLFSTNHYTLYVCKQFCKLKAACVIFQTAFECLHTIRAHLFHSGEFIRLSDIESHIFLSSSSNVSTTPLRQWGFWQCLPFSWTTVRDKHCRYPIAVMGVVDTFEPWQPGLSQGVGLGFFSPPVFGQTDEVVDCTLMISPTTLTFRAVGRFENPGVPVVIRWA